MLDLSKKELLVLIMTLSTIGLLDHATIHEVVEQLEEIGRHAEVKNSLMQKLMKACVEEGLTNVVPSDILASQ